MKLSLVVAAVATGVTHGLDNGRAVTPPLGWRSWNEYGGTYTRCHQCVYARPPPPSPRLSRPRPLPLSRSPLAHAAGVTQPLIEAIMVSVANNKAAIWDGRVMSLKDLGYTDVGLDDNWQDCGQ